MLSPYLQLGKCEATTGAHTTVVLDGRAAHHRSQLIDRARSDLCGLLVAGLTAAQFAARLGGFGSDHLACTTGATALRAVRGDLPGQSALGPGVASPCGSLRGVSSDMLRRSIMRSFVSALTVVLDLLVVLDRLGCRISIVKPLEMTVPGSPS